MLDAIKPLLDNGIINEATRQEISEAWEARITEAKEQVRAELREEFAQRYSHDKQVMVEALDKMVTESLTAELQEFADEKQQLAEDRVAFKKQMVESAGKFNNFMVAKLSEEIKRNMSLSRKGKTSWKKGLVNIISPEARLKMSLKRRKELNPNWQGGLSSVIHLLRESLKYRQWRSDIFTRDNFQCVIGGKEHGNKLHADHIKPFFLIIRENKIDSTEKGFECEELWNLNNGRTLCIECHKNTDTYGWKYKNFL